ncbi:phage tail sheath C-terminal domain-containing protein [Phenylobacterium sp.]|uniref:phage tail sheath family protein n=1 Tax=Phenylobacterium sp. TaxID=1871053 RepID=UPI002600F616|nr:phage tail sheath C-terminal domain-containing protein [Phenylobacterium sp.]
MATMKTPGVYIVEKNAFPNSVVEVATAVPAFVGYTQTASNRGAPLKGKPFRISTMAEFETYYGGAPPTKFKIGRPKPVEGGTDLQDAEFRIGALDAAAAEAATKALVAQAAADAAPDAAAAAAKAAADAAKAQTDAETASNAAATAATAPKTAADAAAKAAMDAAAAATTAKAAADAAATKAAADPTDKAAATASDKAAADAKTAADASDKAAADAKSAAAASDKAAAAAAAAAQVAKAGADSSTKAAKAATDAAALAKSAPGTADAAAKAAAAAKLAAGAASDAKQGYVLTMSGRRLLYYGMRHFFQNGGGACYIVSVGDYDATPDLNALMAGVDSLEREIEPTMVVIPDAVILDQPGCISLYQHVLLHCGQKMKNRVAILDIYSGDKAQNDPGGDPIAKFRDTLGVNDLMFGAAYYPWVHTTIVQDRNISYLDFETGDVTLPLLLAADLAKAPADVQAVLADAARSDDDWAIEAGKYWDTNSRSKVPDGTDPAAVKAAWIADGQAAWIDLRKAQTNDALFRISDTYANVAKQAARHLNLLPPSAAMAGVYTTVDNSRGVWKAPANVSLNSVTAPAVSVSSQDQEDLNVSATGKSINAIRSFIGEGVLVWGARTLDGNSLDWRYINVRRTMIMLEESCRLAAKATVFEPNVAGTWLTIKAMIENFLTGIWKRGGLAGGTPEDAFGVYVGLGETMSPEDILEGILRVTVLVAVSRPAEFIEITFQQQMQKS